MIKTLKRLLSVLFKVFPVCFLKEMCISASDLGLACNDLFIYHILNHCSADWKLLLSLEGDHRVRELLEGGCEHSHDIPPRRSYLTWNSLTPSVPSSNSIKLHIHTPFTVKPSDLITNILNFEQPPYALPAPQNCRVSCSLVRSQSAPSSKGKGKDTHLAFREP